MPQTRDIQIISGDGDSPETPIRFSPCTVAARVAAERDYIRRRFGTEGVDWTRGMHFSRFDQVSQWNIDLSDGTQRAVFFSTENTIYADD